MRKKRGEVEVEKAVWQLKAVKWGLIGALILFVLAIVSFVFGYVLIDYKVSTPHIKNGEEKIFVILPGEGIKLIADNLEAQDLINSDFFFETYVWLKGGRSISLQAGDYNLSSSMSIEDIVKKLRGGEVVSSEVWITIPEGFSIKKIDERLAAKELIKKGEFASLANNPQKIADLKNTNDYAFISNDLQSLEGYLFPDTYKFKKDSVLEYIVTKILDNFDKKLDNRLRYEIKQQESDVEDIIILASIIQNEVTKEEDMLKVSSIFLNRLEIGQALQSDATVNYATGGNNPRPTYDDLEVDSLYNTYKYAGLPPGPISNPGLEAIEAAIYPEATDYFYFLNPQDGNGITIFSKTLEEHNINKAKYLK